MRKGKGGGMEDRGGASPKIDGLGIKSRASGFADTAGDAAFCRHAQSQSEDGRCVKFSKPIPKFGGQSGDT